MSIEGSTELLNTIVRNKNNSFSISYILEQIIPAICTFVMDKETLMCKNFVCDKQI